MTQEIITEIIGKYEPDQSSLIAVLQDVQEHFGYLPKDALTDVSKELDVPLSRVLSLATFYSAFSLQPKGKHPVHVCMGTACHVRGAQPVLEAFERELGIKDGETSEDLEFSLDTVRCVGCCGLAPVVMVGEDVHGKISQSKVSRVTKKYKK
ncbi:MAG: NADH-quinone oxidoreductase subunit NuoE [Candidatus Aminicenantes bacterium]|nr:NADH-quinone oxidoreductase subunit NuoE [Candidatus Aminicenantes bacterium]